MMPKRKATVLKARIHEDLIPYKDDFWFGMTTFAMSGRKPERYAPEDGSPLNRCTFTRTLSPREEEYFNDVQVAHAGTNVALIESFLLTVARFRDPDKFPKRHPLAIQPETEVPHDA